MKAAIKIWSYRNLTPLGKITVIKSQVLSQIYIYYNTYPCHSFVI